MNEELDELVSAYVDGEATPEEMVRVEADPELLELAEEFRGLRLSTLPNPVPAAGLRQQHLATALAAHQTHAAIPPEGEQSTVVSLDAARRRPGAWLARAAAAIIVLGGAGLALSQLSQSGEDGDAASVFESDTADEIELPDSGSAPQAEAEELAADPAEDRASTGNLTDSGSAEAESADGAFEVDDDASEAAVAGSGPIELDGTETSAELLDLVVGLSIEPQPVRASSCFTVLDTEGTTEALGVIDLIYGETPAQLLIFVHAGEPTATLVGPDCEILSAD